MEELIFILACCIIAVALLIMCVPMAHNKSDKVAFIICAMMWGFCGIYCIKNLVSMI